MFERYTDRSRRVIVLAQEQARLLRHPEIDVDHVLLGLAAEGGGVAFLALGKAGVSPEAARAAVAGRRAAAITVPPNPPFTREAKRALELGLRESLELGHNFIGTEHLLLGVTAECERRPESPAAAVLRVCGTTPGEVREAVMTLLRGYGNAPAEEGTAEDDPGGDPLSLVLARLDGIARDVGAIRKHLGLPGA